jgi:hypothetical protein
MSDRSGVETSPYQDRKMSPTDAAPAKKKATLPRWVAILVGIIFVGVGGIKLLGAATLPGCESHDATQSLREIFKEQTGETVEVTDAKLATETNAERNCTAHVTTATETADITYRVFWDGWTKRVQIGEVNAQPIAGAPAAGG